MKRSVVLTLVFSILVYSVSGQGLFDKALATVRLTKSEQIGVKKFESKIAEYEKAAKQKLTGKQKEQSLQSMVDELLLLQAADRDMVYISDAEVQTKLIEFRKSRGIDTEEQLKQALAVSGVSKEELSDSLRKQLLADKYMRVKKPAAFAIQTASESEIKALYNKEIASFVVYPMLQTNQLFFVTQGKSADEKAKAKTRAEAVAKEIRAGGRKAFDEQYAKAVTEKDYEAREYTFYADPRIGLEKTLGESFVEAAFKLKVDAASPVLESNVGYHILWVLKNDEQRLLKIDDVIPTEKITVRDQIKGVLLNLKSQNAKAEAYKQIIEALRKEAEVIIDKSYVWKDS